MKKRRPLPVKFFTVLIAFALLLPSAVIALTDNFVIIDHGEKAYTVFMVIPKEKTKEIKSMIAEEEGVDQVSWEIFRQDTDNYIKARVLKNEYEGSQVVKGIVECLNKFPGAPIGLTWNGGVAITRNDYQHAKSTYQKYVANPREYERTKIQDPKLDPVNPKWHFGPLLGW